MKEAAKRIRRLEYQLEVENETRRILLIVSHVGWGRHSIKTLGGREYRECRNGFVPPGCGGAVTGSSQRLSSEKRALSVFGLH